MKYIEIRHAKVYTCSLHIVPGFKVYDIVKEAMEKADTEPFLHTDFLFKWAAENTRHLVPFKTLTKYPSYRLNSMKNSQKIIMTVTWQLGKERTDFIFEGEDD